jgi:hypothetical protein
MALSPLRVVVRTSNAAHDDLGVPPLPQGATVAALKKHLTHSHPAHPVRQQQTVFDFPLLFLSLPLSFVLSLSVVTYHFFYSFVYIYIFITKTKTKQKQTSKKQKQRKGTPLPPFHSSSMSYFFLSLSLSFSRLIYTAVVRLYLSELRIASQVSPVYPPFFKSG